MKKNFLTGIALTVIAFFVATEVAIAADVTFSGQLRTRYESNGQSTAGNAFTNTHDDDFIATRMRLNANVNINDSTSAFIQMQSVRVWGNNQEGITGNGAGSGNASFTASNADASVGLHQAYFTLKNFASLPVDLKLGRQQVVMDGHRLFGHTGWTTGAQTHDAIRMTHKGGNHKLNYVYIKANEGSRNNDANDFDDIDVHLLHANFQGILGGSLSLYAVYNDDGCGIDGTAASTGNCSHLENDIYTLGFRQAGQLFGINYRGEYYWQGGEAAADAKATGNLNYTSGSKGLGATDRDAYMFGVRLGKKFNNVAMKPSLTIWYDHLSGTDDEDINNGDWGGFNTLFDTGHKFYGHMDLFLSNVNLGTAGLGLTDLAIKGSIQPAPGWTVKADYHWFGTDTNPVGNPLASRATTGANTGVDDDFGEEIDLAIIHKYNANTKIVMGWSQFSSEPLATKQNTRVNPTAQWAYVMFDVKF